MNASIAEFLRYLPHVHERTRRLVLLIPHDDIEWAPRPGRFTFGDLVRHLAGIERWMYGETVHGRPSRYVGHGPELAAGYQEDGYAATLDYYDRLHEDAMASFALLTDARMGEKCQTPTGTNITVWKWLRAHLEHEAHHRGQLYVMLADRGVPTPPLYGLTEEELVAASR
jgi:uncharacterized damage-inducible protein DinB